MKEIDTDSEDQSSLRRLLPWVFIGVSILWAAGTFLVYWFITQKSEEAFSGINSLFSALAFGGVITAIFLQSRELQLQRRELKDTRAVLQKQQEQLEAHTEAFEKQNFERTFFSLIELHHTIVNSMTTSYVGEERRGRDCFELFYKILLGNYSEEKSFANARHDFKPPPEDETFLETVYSKFYTNSQSAVGHYFRNLYNIVRFIKDSSVKDKHFYIRLVRSQLSVFELSILFYNCLSTPGRGFKPLVEEFALLKTVEDSNLLSPLHRRFYNPTAFDE